MDGCPGAGPVRAGADRCDGVAQSFHCLVVLLVVAQYATKWVPAGLASLSEGWLMNAWHLAIGPVVLLLMLLRLLWRPTHRTPAPPSDMPQRPRLLSPATHWLFHAITIVLEVLGSIAASGHGALVKRDGVEERTLPTTGAGRP